MAYLSRQKVAEIIRNAPQGTTPAGIVAALRQKGHILEGYNEPTAQDVRSQVAASLGNADGLVAKARNVASNIVGSTELGRGMAAMFNAKHIDAQQNRALNQTQQTQELLIQRIKEKKARGEDTSKLVQALQQLGYDAKQSTYEFNAIRDLGVSNRDIAGSAIRTAATVASFGTYGAAAKGMKGGELALRAPAITGKGVKAVGAVRGAIEGAKAGAKAGAVSGSIFGALQSLGLGVQDEDKGAGEVIGQAIGGGITGGITGGVIGGAIGAGTGAYQGRKNFRAQLEAKVGKSNAPYVERMKQASTDTAAELSKDPQQLKFIKATQDVRASEALPMQRAIDAGDIPAEAIYKDVNTKTLQPNFAQGRIDDIAAKLNRAQPGLGDEWARTVDINNTTYDGLIKSGLDKIDEAASKIERAGVPSAETALFKRDPKTGKIIGDIDAKKLMRTTGFEDGDIAMMKSGTNADKQAYIKMLDTADELRDNPALIAQKRPTQVAGKNGLDTIRQIQAQKNAAGKEISTVVRTQLADKTIKTESVYARWVSDLADDGVAIADDGTLNFTGSRYEDVTGAQSLLEKAHKKALQLQTTTSAAKAHNFKGQLDELVDFGNNEGGISGSASRLVKGLRSGIDAQLDTSFGAYKAANERYAKAIGALDRIETIIGKNTLKADDVVVERKIGQILQRMFSNSETTAIDLTTTIDDAVAQLGIRNENTLTNQAYFARLLEDIYGVQKNSLAGRVSQGTTESLQKFDGIRRLAKAPIETTVNTALDVFNPSSIEKADALRAYVEQLLIK